MAGKIKTGILGGTFDPIHIGHLILAQAAYEQLELDRVFIIPAGRPPHKKDRKGATDEQRIDMVRLAAASNPAFEVELLEMESQEYSYTYVTLQRLHQKYPDDDFYFIIGQDSLETFETWREPAQIVEQAHIVAADRPDCDVSKMQYQIERNKKLFGGDFIAIECPDIQISSHEIRERTAEGKSCRYYVPDAVFDYMTENDLYRNL
ncbi:MAG: nicotinate-nucleotide adenylyltransferase [Lachnospiraceae bacterium]|nr:nicotinate-nucleotide adenylyltransferase [Lachnospiraceae bacterium]